jgi:aminoglycoside phosphotransferase (APT) family kinase protein
MMNVPQIVKTEIAPTIGFKSADLRINPRQPLENQSNRLYDVYSPDHHLIAKEYLKAKELEFAPLREYKALQVLSPLDIAPQPIYYEPSVGLIVIYEYMEGEMWDRRPLTTGDLHKLLDVYLEINSVSAKWFSRGYEHPVQSIESEFSNQIHNYLDWAIREFESGQRIAEICLKLSESAHSIFTDLYAQEPVLCFCKADPRFANMIKRPNGKLGLVDWEDSGLLDPAKDIADLLTHPNQEDIVNWKEWQSFFVKPYLDARSQVDKSIAYRLQLYLAILPIYWLTVLIKRGLKLAFIEHLADWTINGLSGNERLRRYLARALSWPNMEYSDTLSNLKDIEFFPKI